MSSYSETVHYRWSQRLIESVESVAPQGIPLHTPALWSSDLCAGCDRGALCEPAQFGRVEFISEHGEAAATGVCDRCLTLLQVLASVWHIEHPERLVWFSGPVFAWDNAEPRSNRAVV